MKFTTTLAAIGPPFCHCGQVAMASKVSKMSRVSAFTFLTLGGEKNVALKVKGRNNKYPSGFTLKKHP